MQRERQPDDDALDLALGDELARARVSPCFVAGRSTGSIGVASVPVGSLSAQPQRAEP